MCGVMPLNTQSVKNRYQYFLGILMDNFLDDGQRASLRSAHRLERDGKIRDRIKAVLMADRGKSISEIADILLVDEETVRRHLRDYLDRDSTGGGSGGSKGKLTPEQSKRLREVFGDSDVMGAAWAVAKAWELFKIGFSISGMTKWLKNNGFSWKRCDGCPAKADPVEQAIFIKKYRRLKAGLREDEALVFLDAVHPTMATKLANAWSIKGQRKTVFTTGCKKRVNVLGSLNPSTLKMVTTFHETVNSATMEVHLTELRRAYPASTYSTVHIVLDQGSYCVSKDTRAAAEELGIRLWHLPPYSPNLNLIERAWKVMNEKVRNNVYFDDEKTFVAAIEGFFKTGWNKAKTSLSSRFTDNFQTVKNPAF
jgi:transposase